MAKCINVKYDGKPLYDIVIEKTFDRLSDEFNKLGVTGRKLCIVSDSNVARLYADDVAKELEKQVIKCLRMYLKLEKKIRILIQ